MHGHTNINFPEILLEAHLLGHLRFGVRMYRKEVVFGGVEWICVAEAMIVWGWGGQVGCRTQGNEPSGSISGRFVDSSPNFVLSRRTLSPAVCECGKC